MDKAEELETKDELDGRDDVEETDKAETRNDGTPAVTKCSSKEKEGESL